MHPSKRRPYKYLPAGTWIDVALSALNTWRKLDYFPNVWNPRTLNEYFLAEKLTFHSDLALARRVTDKAQFKEWLEEIELSELVVPTVHAFSDIREAERLSLQREVIVKPTHRSGDVIIVEEPLPERFSPHQLSIMREWLNADYYKEGREINYRGLFPSIIVEELLRDEHGMLPDDIKIFCINGVPFIIQLDADRHANHTRQLYDINWNLLPYSQNVNYPRNPEAKPPLPNLAQILNYASKLSRHFYLCRIDMYVLSPTDIRAGEITFFPGNGANKFIPENGDLRAGELLRLALHQSGTK